MHTVSYKFLMKPEESAKYHQTLSPWVGSGHATGDEDDHDSTKGTRHSIRRGEFQLVFLSPEALFATLEWRRMLCLPTSIII